MTGRRSSIAVVMAARNAADTIEAALGSLLRQTRRADEIVVVDDASTDRTAEIARAMGAGSVRLIRNETRAGVARSLNRALEACSSDLVARMDADDISAPMRLEVQEAFLASNRDIAIVGSWVRTIDERSRLSGQINLPISCAAICGYAALSPPFRHPSVVLRRSALDELGLVYDPKTEGAEDYDLWARMLPRYRAANMPRHLLDYRVHPRAVSVERRRSQAGVHADAAMRYAAEMTGRTDLDARLFRAFADAIVLRTALSPHDLSALCVVLDEVNTAIAVRFEGGHASRQRAAAEQYAVLARLCSRSGPAALSALTKEVAGRFDLAMVRSLTVPLFRDLRRLGALSQTRLGRRAA